MMFRGVSRVLKKRNARNFSLLSNRLDELVPIKRAGLQTLMKELGDEKLGDCTVAQAVGGMRSVKSMIWETSLLDAEEGIRFRNMTIPEIKQQLPTYEKEPCPEALLWLLLTGEKPNEAELESVRVELMDPANATLPDYVEQLIADMPKNVHPMTQFAMAVLALQSNSKFAKAYSDGVHKNTFHTYVLTDTIELLAKLPRIAALIYRHKFHDGVLPEHDASLDYSVNFNRMLGFQDKGFDELMRLYLTIHADHEGGNVSAHTTHLVGSALSDPYLSFAAGLTGLAGPLHGLANQEVLKWTQEFSDSLKKQGLPLDHDSVRKQAWATLNSGKVIPGFGHAVLRKTDPRYMIQREFALKHMPEDPLVKLVSLIYEVVPTVLTEHGKTKNPWPNVDAHSGVLLTHYNLTEYEYYTVLFGVSRAFGVLSQLYWDRALGLPLERPKSVTLEWIKQNVKKSA